MNNTPGIGGPSQWAAKLYHPGQADNSQYEKLWHLIQHPVTVRPPNRVALPRALLFSPDSGRPAGFIMELLPQNSWKKLVEHYNPQTSQQEQTDIWEQHRWRIARNLSQVLEDVHNAGHAAGDLSETNTLANAQDAVALIDTDSWQVNASDRRWNCTIARPEYTPPEISQQLGQPCREPDCPRNPTEGAHNTTQSCIPRTPEHDNYILGILVFKLLMQGEEPFGQSRAAAHLPPDQAPVDKMAQIGLFRYGSRHYECCGPRNQLARERWENLPQGIRYQLERALTPPTWRKAASTTHSHSAATSTRARRQPSARRPFYTTSKSTVPAGQADDAGRTSKAKTAGLTGRASFPQPHRWSWN